MSELDDCAEQLKERFPRCVAEIDRGLKQVRDEYANGSVEEAKLELEIRVKKLPWAQFLDPSHSTGKKLSVKRACRRN